MAGPARNPLPSFRSPAALIACCAALGIGGCSSLPSLPRGDSFLGLITPYRMEIVQGNVVTEEQAARVKPGMTRAQVRDILGSPMLTDIFHLDRWDYVFTIRRSGTPTQRRNVIAYFSGDRLERLESPELPTENAFVASISRPPSSGAIPPLELTPEQKQALPAPARVEAQPAPPVGAVRSYPPLEPS